MSFICPPADCPLCPRLVEFRDENRRKFPDKFNAPVPSFGSIDAEFLVIGLAPGLKGANFTGRPFTGDYAGDLLYATLLENDFARGDYGRQADDGLELVNCRITNAVRCVPPQNKPTTQEKNTCQKFLQEEMAAMRHLKVILTLGLISHQAFLKTMGVKQSSYKFAHHAIHDFGRIKMINSYHCSRYNTQTKRLTEDMFDGVIKTVRDLIDT